MASVTKEFLLPRGDAKSLRAFEIFDEIFNPTERAITTPWHRAWMDICS
jgi:hypothetical protein